MRELFGRGTLFGATVLPNVEDGGWFQPLGVMLLAPSAFFILGWSVVTRSTVLSSGLVGCTMSLMSQRIPPM